jgi:hypothetical protein
LIPSRTLPVIGIHREELAFGDAVAEGLARAQRQHWMPDGDRAVSKKKAQCCRKYEKGKACKSCPRKN